MRFAIAAFSIVATIFTTQIATAQTNPVVVELYTSQGCSSCPPADALMQELATRPGVIALALHVDYWDYIGWADSFADPAYTARQQQYARVANQRTIYTPQMIIGGKDRIVGTEAMTLADTIRDHAAMQSGVAVRAVRSGDTLQIMVRPQVAQDGAYVVQLVRYTPSSDVSITRGENAGRTINYVNTVNDWRVVGDWNGRDGLDLQVPISGDTPAVVIVQRSGPRRIVGAARVQ